MWHQKVAFQVSNFEVFLPKYKVPSAESLFSWFTQFTVTKVKKSEETQRKSLHWYGASKKHWGLSQRSGGWFTNICWWITKQQLYINSKCKVSTDKRLILNMVSRLRMPIRNRERPKTEFSSSSEKSPGSKSPSREKLSLVLARQVLGELNIWAVNLQSLTLEMQTIWCHMKICF